MKPTQMDMTDYYWENLEALAHEIWAVAQLAPSEGIVDGVARIEALLHRAARRCQAPQTMEPDDTAVTVRYDLSPAAAEGAIRDKLVEMGWTPPDGRSSINSSTHGATQEEARVKVIWWHHVQTPHLLAVAVETQPGVFECQLPHLEYGDIRTQTHYITRETLDTNFANGGWVKTREI